MAEDRFGEIRIDSSSPAGQEGPDVPFPHDSEVNDEKPSSQISVSSRFAKEKHYRRRSSKRARSFHIPLPSRKTVLCLLILPFMVLLYSVGTYVLVPVIIKDFLVPKLSHNIDRPIEVARIVFSPFDLKLHAENVHVGPLYGDTSGKELLVTENARFQFSLDRFFDGKLVCRQAVLEGLSLNVVRRKDTTIDLQKLADIFLSQSTDNGIRYWPAWLLLDEVQIAAGQISVDDRLTKKVFNIEQIQFHLPSSDIRNLDKSAMPKLGAVIDSSPFEINAVRFQNQSGAWRTGFTFEFKKVVMDNFKELFPLPPTGLELTEGEMDITLDIVLPEGQKGHEGLLAEGEAKLRRVRWNDLDAGAVLTVPEARLVYQVKPADKYIHLSSVEFYEPELRLSGQEDAKNPEPLASLFYLQSVISKVARAEDNLKVSNFLLNNGKVIMSRGGKGGGRNEWNDVTFNMVDFTASGHRKFYSDAPETGSYSFRAKDISTKQVADFFSEGRFDDKSILKGKLALNGLDLERYPTLLPNSIFSMTKGKTDISFEYEFAGHQHKQGNDEYHSKIFNGSVSATEFSLLKNRKNLAAGKKLNCSNFHFDIPAKTVVCEQLKLSKSEVFADRIFAKQEAVGISGQDDWHFKVNSLQVNKSKIHTTMQGLEPSNKSNRRLVFQDVTLEGKNLQQEKVKDNIKATARIGKKGRLSIQGSYSPVSTNGYLQLEIRNMQLSLLRSYYSPWFVPPVKKGAFSAKGNLKLPIREFQGKISVDGLEAGEGSGAKINLKHAFVDDCTYRHIQKMFDLDEIVVKEPEISPGLSSGDSPVRRYLRMKEETLPATVRIGKVRIENGSFSTPEPIIYPGYQPVLNNISGTFLPGTGTDQKFSVKGSVNKQGSFLITGNSSLKNVQSYVLEVQNFPFVPFDYVLKEEAGFSGLKTHADWTQNMVVDGDTTKRVSNITINNVTPERNGSFAPMLSMIVDDEKRFTMEMEGKYDDKKTTPFLLEKVIQNLRHLKVKASISPRLVLKSTLPDLDLSREVIFAPGKTLQEGAVQLTPYRELLLFRPLISLQLEGQYDPVADGDVLLAAIQEEADRKREIENKRRALQKVKILQQQKRQQKELKEQKVQGPGVVVEEIPVIELTSDLDPLPPVKIQLDPSQLEELALERARMIYDYLVNQLELDPDRVQLATEVKKGTASVQIGILPLNHPQ